MHQSRATVAGCLPGLLAAFPPSWKKNAQKFLPEREFKILTQKFVRSIRWKIPERTNNFSSLEMVVLNFPNLSTLGPEFAHKCHLWQLREDPLLMHCDRAPVKTKRDTNTEIVRSESPNCVLRNSLFPSSYLKSLIFWIFLNMSYVLQYPKVAPQGPPVGAL